MPNAKKPKRPRLALLFVLLIAGAPIPLVASAPEPTFAPEPTQIPHQVTEDLAVSEGPRIIGQTIPGFGGGAPELAMVLDDGVAEGDFGVNGAEAFQFMWINRLSPPAPMFLEQIHVLFPASPNIAIGAPIDLVVYRDTDSDPANGAELLAVFTETVQIADGVSFSTYSISLDEVLNPSHDLYLGVIPRFIESGVTPPTHPASLDTTDPQGQSWLITWQGDPPASPELPSDDSTINIDDLTPGNWLIRGFGSPAPVIEIPTSTAGGLLLMGLLMLITAVIFVRRP